MDLAEKLLRQILFIVVNIAGDVMVSAGLLMCVQIVVGIDFFLSKGFTVVDGMVRSGCDEVLGFVRNSGGCLGEAEVMRFVVFLSVLVAQES